MSVATDRNNSMPIYSKKEFAALCKQTTSYLSVQIKRGKVCLTLDGKINTSDPVNTHYVEKIYGRLDLAPFDELKPVKKVTPLRNPLPGKKAKKVVHPLEGGFDDEDDPGGGDFDEDLAVDLDNANLNTLTYTQLEKIYKFRQGEHLKKRTEREEIEIAKKKGEVIPAELLPPVIIQHNQAFLTAFKNCTEQLLTDFGKVKDFDIQEIADMRRVMLSAINKAAKDATENSLNAIEVIVKNYMDKRGAGQKA